MESEAIIEGTDATTPESGYGGAVAVEAGQNEGKGGGLSVEGFMSSVLLGPASPAEGA